MTIIEIAKLAGVSKSTVSRYLNNGYVSSENRQKIEAVIKKTAYKPSRAAKNMRNKRTGFIGVVLPKISTETSARVMDGITSELTRHNYDTLIANTGLNLEKEIDYLKTLRAGQVDGIIFMATEITDRHLEAMEKLNVPIVVLAQYIKEYPCVYYDDYSGAKDITKAIIDTGKKNIAFIGVDKKDISVGYERKRGYEDALKEGNIKINKKIVMQGNFSIESGFESAKKIIESGEKVDAIFAVTDNLAIGVLEYLNQIDKKVPKDISLVGMGDSKISKYINPKLSTVHFHYKTSGIESGKIIVELLKKGVVSSKGIDKKIKLGSRLILRDSI
ncbi:MAG: LacI family DNA-binding transcriptional regulator [Clostridium sp.]